MTTITISKEEFESIVYVATSAHTEVFDSVQPYITMAADTCAADILGGLDITDGKVLDYARRFICLDAFLRVFRQLDLVLTSTGFGVVANQTTSPASKQRVDALQAQLQLEREHVLGSLLRSLTNITDWGDTTAAQQCIRTLYHDIRFYEQAALQPVSFKDWQAAQNAITEADIMLRRRIGDEQMNVLLDAVRHGSTVKELTGAVVLMRDIISLFVNKSPFVPERMRNLMNYIEALPQVFNSYMQSEAYKINHYETFKNKKDSPGFFFIG